MMSNPVGELLYAYAVGAGLIGNRTGVVVFGHTWGRAGWRGVFSSSFHHIYIVVRAVTGIAQFSSV